MNIQPLRVLIVDDSRVFRGVIEDALAERSDVKVVGSVWSGEKAIEFCRQSLPDFVTLDIEMPGIGGLETLKSLRELSAVRQQPIGVLLISSYTRRGAAVTIEGLQEGAFDFIAKPDGPNAQVNAATLRDQLYQKIAAFRSSQTRRSLPTAAKDPTDRTVSATRRKTRFQAVVIGASTGGPEALTRLLPTFAPGCPVPMFLVQHLPPDFTEYFAASLSRRCRSRVVEAVEGTVAESGVLYVARSGKHMVLNPSGGRVTIGQNDGPPENGCRPAADVLFRSAAVAYSGQVLTVVLTGMGSDGAKGASVLKRAGAHVLVQDEATSVVWGMPGSTVASGAADEVLPIDEIGRSLLSHLGIGG
jgi:two-component system chemotaxis response regulator CheB